MKKNSFYFIFIFCLTSCTNKTPSGDADISEKNMEEKVAFFPVTSFIKGQILDIRSNAANPLKIITMRYHRDSSWLKMEDLQTELAPFLQPLIDTGNLTGMFLEKKFLDQTLDAYTFTYDPIKILPDSMHLLHWDVYVKPADGRVTRIYMLKKIDSVTQQQLTWEAGKWSKIVTLKNTLAGNTEIEKEQMIIWNF